MSIAEVNRQIVSYNRTYKARMQIQAQMDWNLANLIGCAIGRVLSNDITMPKVEEAYPNLFQVEQQNPKTEASVARFMMFAQSHNAKWKMRKDT